MICFLRLEIQAKILARILVATQEAPVEANIFMTLASQKSADAYLPSLQIGDFKNDNAAKPVSH